MGLIEVGQRAPSFTLKDQAGKSWSLKDFAGQPLVMYFYPKDDTSGCTAQACDFRDQLPEFEKLGAKVVGISPDNEKSHAKFVGKYDLNFTLLADVPGEDKLPKVCDAYGVWGEKSMYGKKYMGVTRTTYLISGHGKVLKRWDKVSVPGHVKEVRGAIAELV